MNAKRIRFIFGALKIVDSLKYEELKSNDYLSTDILIIEFWTQRVKTDPYY